jgi:hypothetical protein
MVPFAPQRLAPIDDAIVNANINVVTVTFSGSFGDRPHPARVCLARAFFIGDR